MNLNKYLDEKDFVKRVLSATRSKEYLVVLARQIDQIEINRVSIETLVTVDCIEDAYTVFRKLLETFFTLNCILEHPEVAKVYLEHLSYLSDKTIGHNIGDVREYKDGEPDGFLEYGYVESLIDTSESDFRYTVKSVAKAGGVENMYNWYRISSNFVHNNLTLLNVNKEDLKQKLEIMIGQVMDTLVSKLNRYMR